MLEVCIDSLESATNAVLGGADELEVCSSLVEGGLTPSAGLVKKVMDLVYNWEKSSPPKTESPQVSRTKVNVMIRCRGGSDFCYNEAEIGTMLADIQIFKEMGVDRFVFGAITDEQQIDGVNCTRVIKAAYPKPVTFHRAFDVCKDSREAVDKIVNLGFNRLLTSGQRNSAADLEATEIIRSLINIYGDKIEIMPGAGVSADNVDNFIKLGCKIVHASCKVLKCLPKIESNVCMGAGDKDFVYITDEKNVRKMKKSISSSVTL